MPSEPVNAHVHHASWWRQDWHYWTDQSLDEGITRFSQDAVDGIDGDEMLNLVKSAADFDQLTGREVRKLLAVIHSPSFFVRGQADEIRRTLDAKLGALIKDPYDDSDEWYAENRQEWIGTGARTGAGDPFLAGEDLHALLNQLDRLAHPNPYRDWINWPGISNFPLRG